MWDAAVPPLRAESGAHLSIATAMRAFAAVVILAACALRSRALAARDVTDATAPVRRLATCASALGLSKCLSALAAYRAENALTSFKDHRADFSLARDVRNFPWEQYANKSEDVIYTQLCDGTEQLLQYRSLHLNLIPGYEFKLISNGNGTLKLDVFNGEPQTERSMKKLRKKFYEIVPILLLPGLIMSAILPFVLPAMKMMTVAVGMLNNMALSGAVFTLLRNNAFNDKYDKKVIYVNEGYHNEKHSKWRHKPNNVADFGNHQSQSGVSGYGGEDFEVVEEAPITNEELINQYYGDKFVKVAGDVHRREHG